MLNSKFEALSAYVKTTADKNPKQTCLTTVKIQNPNYRNLSDDSQDSQQFFSNRMCVCFENLDFGHSILFRISDFVL